MRVALVTNAPPDSGAGKPAHLLAEALRSPGAPARDVDLYTLEAGDHTVRRNGEIVARLRPLTTRKPLAWVRLGRRLPLAGYDLVHLTNQSLAFLVSHFSLPAVVTVWDLIELVDPQEPGGALVARYLYRGIPRAREVLAVSEATARAVTEIFAVPKARLTVVPPAASPTFAFQPDIWETAGGQAFLAAQRVDQRRPRILYVGSEHARKNLPRLLEAIARVRQTVPAVEFVKIGGAGVASGRAAFAATADRLSLWPVLRLVERAGDTDLRYWYHAATVLAFPTLHEGFGFPPLEAMACGTPVVTANRSSLPEVVGDAAILVDPQSVEEIAGALERVLGDAALRAALRQQGLARATRFTWAKTVVGTLAAYQRALRR